MNIPCHFFLETYLFVIFLIFYFFNNFSTIFQFYIYSINHFYLTFHAIYLMTIISLNLYHYYLIFFDMLRNSHLLSNFWYSFFYIFHIHFQYLKDTFSFICLLTLHKVTCKGHLDHNASTNLINNFTLDTYQSLRNNLPKNLLFTHPL